MHTIVNTRNTRNNGQRSCGSSRLYRPLLRVLVAALVLEGLCLSQALLGRHEGGGVAWAQAGGTQPSPQKDPNAENPCSRIVNPLDARQRWIDSAKRGDKNLKRASLKEADLSGADLSGANLTLAHLLFSNLKGANLNASSLVGADLSGADVGTADVLYAKANKNIKGIDVAQWKNNGGIYTE